MKCMYCREESPKATFSGREHVVPQSFGTFDERNFTLHDKVCDSCNSYFAKNLDLVMARDSYEGISRLAHGIIEPSEYKHLGNRSTVVFQQRGGVFEGAYCYQEYNESLGKVVARPLPQIGFKIKGSEKWEFFLAREFRGPADFHVEKYDLSKHNAYLVFGMANDEAARALSTLGLAFNPSGVVHDQGEGLELSVTWTMTELICRCIAKISFNYLAVWCSTQVLLDPSFDRVREYIRNGVGQFNDFLVVVDRPILGDEPIERWRRKAHILTLFEVPGRAALIGEVSLMNLMTYKVLLGRAGVPKLALLDIGHLFDIDGRRISELRLGETTFEQLPGVTTA